MLKLPHPHMHDVLISMNFGSVVYGTNTPTSDTDVKGIFVPCGEDLLLQKAPVCLNFSSKENKHQKNTAKDVDEEYFSISEYLKHLSAGQTIAVDMLFVPENHILSLSKKHEPVWRYLQEHAREFIPTTMNAFVGYCRTQASRYSMKGERLLEVKEVMATLDSLPAHDKLIQHGDVLGPLAVGRKYVRMVVPESAPGGPPLQYPHLAVADKMVPMTATVKFAKDVFGRILKQYGERADAAAQNGGADLKALSHAVRVFEEAKELVTTGRITFPRPEREWLREIRAGKVPNAVETIGEYLDRGIPLLDSLAAKQTLLSGPNPGAVRNIVAELHSEALRDIVLNRADYAPQRSR